MKIENVYLGYAVNGVVSFVMAAFLVVCLIGFFGICAELWELGKFIFKRDDE